ncbi:flagellin [Methylocaldum szegediense]|uniref:flagellin N-terminal helical domain-containing protein n=1 Tax=Methylocaldum szegediense TaxID=73780 RepID=UPI0004145857|nr:flagellin [Methylocaldum szegediense]
MSQVINTNIASLNAQRQLLKSTNSMQTAMERLSSGLRINSAKDDAAGLAISDRMTSQIRGLNQAVRNANDGISMAQTAEGALDEATNILQRIRDLSVQAANDSNSSSDRQKLQDEVTSLVSELDRIATSTQYNGRTLFDGNFGTATFQIGANANQTVNLSIGNFRTNKYGNYQVSGNSGKANLGTASSAAAATVTVNGYIGSKDISTTATDTAKTIAEKINNETKNTGVTATARNEISLSFAATGNYTLRLTSDNSSAKTLSFALTGTSASDGLDAAVKAFNNIAGETGVTAKVSDDGTKVILTNATGNDIKLEDTTTANAGDVIVAQVDGGGSQTLTADATANTAVANGYVTLDSDHTFSVTDGGSGFNLAGTASLKAVNTLSITSVDNATLAIKIVDSAIASIDNQRASLGALQNRLQSTIANLQSISQNLSAARSRVKDADFAEETANLSRSQILQQAGTAMLAQANASTQNVLSLLRG